MKRFFKFIIIIVLCAACWYAWNLYQQDQTDQAQLDQTQIEQIYDIGNLPEYSGEPSVVVSGGEPGFAPEDLKPEFYEKFSELDSLGRCGTAEACVDREHMPEGEREEIDTVKPSGWKGGKYDFIDNGGFLYNRCHMIGWQLTGQNAEERNLITGTRYMNVEGMLPYENQVARYVRRSGNHVLYRVTPVFQGEELLSRGVHLEAESVEDAGEGLSFNVFCYNVQPGVEIDYMTGANWLAENPPEPAQEVQLPEPAQEVQPEN